MGKRQWWMSRILYISAANYDWKHLENSKIGLENSWKTLDFFLLIEWEVCHSVTIIIIPCVYNVTFATVIHPMLCTLKVCWNNVVDSCVLLAAFNQWLHHRRGDGIAAWRHSRHGCATVSCTESDSGVAERVHRAPAYASSVPPSDTAQSSVAILGLVNSHQGRQLQVCWMAFVNVTAHY